MRAKLEALMAEWRQQAAEEREDYLNGAGSAFSGAWASVLERCASDLEKVMTPKPRKKKVIAPSPELKAALLRLLEKG